MEETTAGDAERPISAAAAARDEADCPGWLHAGLVVAAPAAEAGLEKISTIRMLACGGTGLLDALKESRDRPSRVLTF